VIAGIDIFCSKVNQDKDISGFGHIASRGIHAIDSDRPGSR
jgi:hypothetical protein